MRKRVAKSAEAHRARDWYRLQGQCLTCVELLRAQRDASGALASDDLMQQDDERNNMREVSRDAEEIHSA